MNLPRQRPKMMNWAKGGSDCFVCGEWTRAFWAMHCLRANNLAFGVGDGTGVRSDLEQEQSGPYGQTDRSRISPSLSRSRPSPRCERKSQRWSLTPAALGASCSARSLKVPLRDQRSGAPRKPLRPSPLGSLSRRDRSKRIQPAASESEVEEVPESSPKKPKLPIRSPAKSGAIPADCLLTCPPS